jgi:hypothetical protein
MLGASNTTSGEMARPSQVSNSRASAISVIESHHVGTDRLMHINLPGIELIVPGQVSHDPILDGGGWRKWAVEQWAEAAARVPGPLVQGA